MFYCPLHNWYSDEAPCPACHKTITTTLATSTEGTGEILPEPERIEVKQMFDLNNIYQPQCVRTGFVTSKPIPEDKFPAIKSAIEAVLNNEDIVPEVFGIFRYTPQQLANAFIAAREAIIKDKELQYRYHTIQDYINFKKQ